MSSTRLTIAGLIALALLGLLALQWRTDALRQACDAQGGTFTAAGCEPARGRPIIERDLRRS